MQGSGKMEIAVMTCFFAKRNMDINTGQFVCDLMNNLASAYLLYNQRKSQPR
jgi:hypothetical protein